MKAPARPGPPIVRCRLAFTTPTAAEEANRDGHETQDLCPSSGMNDALERDERLDDRCQAAGAATHGAQVYRSRAVDRRDERVDGLELGLERHQHPAGPRVRRHLAHAGERADRLAQACAPARSGRPARPRRHAGGPGSRTPPERPGSCEQGLRRESSLPAAASRPPAWVAPRCTTFFAAWHRNLAEGQLKHHLSHKLNQCLDQHLRPLSLVYHALIQDSAAEVNLHLTTPVRADQCRVNVWWPPPWRRALCGAGGALGFDLRRPSALRAPARCRAGPPRRRTARRSTGRARVQRTRTPGHCDLGLLAPIGGQVERHRGGRGRCEAASSRRPGG